jgi:hypothetical protein
MTRILPPNLWLPADQTPAGATCARCGYRLWWRDDLEEATMPGMSLWHCRNVIEGIGSRFGLRIRPLGFVHQPGHA